MLIFVPLAAVDYGTEDDVRAIREELLSGIGLREPAAAKRNTQNLMGGAAD